MISSTLSANTLRQHPEVGEGGRWGRPLTPDVPLECDWKAIGASADCRAVTAVGDGQRHATAGASVATKGGVCRRRGGRHTPPYSIVDSPAGLAGPATVSAVWADLIIIDGTGGQPPFEQVRSQLARRISDRELAVGTRLPTVRALATELGLAANTVARAYRELEEAGMVETRGRAGTFVSALGDRSRVALRQAAAEYAATVRALGIDADEALRAVQVALDR